MPFLTASEGNVLHHVSDVINAHSRAYANTRISFLKSFYRWVLSQGLRTGDPTARLHMRKPRTEPRLPFAPRELRRLLHATQTPMERALLLILLGSGARRAELLATRVQDIDWRRGAIFIRYGKGERERWVAPGREAMKALKEYLRGQEAGLIWPMSRSTLKRVLDRLAIRAQVQQVFPHRFRVTMVCGLLDAGADAISVGSVAGHSLEMVKHYQRAVERKRALGLQAKFSLADRIGRTALRILPGPPDSDYVRRKGAELAELDKAVADVRSGRRRGGASG